MQGKGERREGTMWWEPRESESTLNEQAWDSGHLDLIKGGRILIKDKL